MMTAIQFVNFLRGLDIRIWLEEDKLRFRAPADRLTPEIRAELVRRKPELMTLLRQGQATEGPALVRANRDVKIPLTFAQQRLWFLDQLQPDVPAYNVYDAVELDHEIDVAALQRAVTELFRRHELLRTTFPALDGVPMQRILPPYEVPLPVVDLSGLRDEVKERERRRLTSEEASAPFDLARGPLLRVKLLRLGEARHVWLLSIHHIVSDDWSKKLLNQELEALYTACRAGLPSPLPELPIQWADFALWQQRWLSGSNLDAHVTYWKRQLEGELPKLTFAMDHPRRDPATGRNGKFHFPPSLSAALRRLCEAEGATLFMVLLAGYCALLARYTRQDDIIVGSPISDRHRIETEGLIGFLLNTLPLRVQVDERASFRDLLRQVKETCLGGYSYQAVPYEALMQDLLVDRTTSGNPLFQTVLALLNTPPVQPGSSALWGPETGELFPRLEGDVGTYVADACNGTTKFDLSITLIEHQDGIWGRTEYNGDIFDEGSIAALVGRFQILLRSAAADPARSVGALSLMAAAERTQVLGAWSRGAGLTLDTSALQQWVEQRARSDPSAIAIDDDGTLLTYAELNARANRLAHALHRRGVRAETCVGVLLERSAAMFVAILAALKAGAAYVPLDTTYPSERLRVIADDARIAWLVSNESLSGVLQTYAQRCVCLDRDADAIASEGTQDPHRIAQGENVACVLYTSGSTGRPKGVALTHRALVNYARDAANDYGIHGADRVLQFASVAFDASLEESLVAFSEGATLVLRPERMIDSTAAFVDHCERLRLTVMVLPTAYWHELISTLEAHPLPSHLRCVVIGGERAIPEKLAQWQRLVGDRIQVFNTYGPTEGTIAVTRCLFPAQAGVGPAGREVCIGRPVANSSVYVLDRWMQPVPHGVPGEIHLGGAALARGYLDQPAMTADRFVPDPFASQAGARLYRTGDLARFLPDGSIEYLGRVDAQVKIRGYRVEPREIELMLQAHDAVKDAVIVAREDEPGDRRLVAYVVLRDGHEAGAAELRSFLKPRLPSYMLPSAFVLLPVLPLNVNGKVNHRSLPKPGNDRASIVEGEYIEPRTATEMHLAVVWKTVLQLERIGIDENFFDLGGHSLLATRVIARVNDALKIDLPLRRLFEAPTIAELAPVVECLVQTTDGDANRVTSLRSLRDGGVAPDLDRMLAGLEHLTEVEIEALLAEEDDPGRDRLA